jgi:hypothetical protein
MQDILLVNRSQPVEHLLHDHQGLAFQNEVIPDVQILVEGPALVVIHHEVAGAIGFEKGSHPDDVGVLLKFGQHARFLQEALKPELKVLPLLFREGPNGMGVRVADGNVVGQVLLHRYRHFQHLVECQIGDAESADAEDTSQSKLVAKKRTLPERAWISARGVFLEDVLSPHDRASSR